ncbi:carboxymethylenebutenolidase [Actinokineospora baliensis]|uniref:dienelactone hydrolase family protein n=1 Tax=Actinokineospora baliensis TaxID=547056 RepID=UPI0027DE6AAA|nr:dienelactone hydrolase family protein [Actinokineospora baliensis]MBM7774402.1 carboxymethylenebutenolidase [Actinokineospora baliensis]
MSLPTTTVRIPTPDGEADAIVAHPHGPGPFPGVLLYPDAFGPRPEIERKAAELAEHGYYVLAPNIFYRHGQAPVVELPDHIRISARDAIITQLVPLMRAHTTDLVLRDADAYLQFLDAQPEVASGPVATIGYCVGAILALRTAAAHPEQVAAIAGFHPGPLVTDAPDSPHRVLAKLTAHVHIGFATPDISAEALAELTQALNETGVPHTTEIYPNTIHGFTMSDTDVFSPDGHQHHWDRLLALLKEAHPA